MSEQPLEQALTMARRSLEVLETQAAGYSALTIPAHLFLELEDKRKEIARLEAQARAGATGAPGLPHNLPRRGEFVGREAYKVRVHEALRSRSYLVSIEGIGGIGKTSLALEVAYECLQPGEAIAHFDGAIWASARDRALTLDDVLDAVARTLDYPGIAQKPLEEKREGVVRLLRSGAYLLLVDNFETISDAAVGEFLQDLPEPSKALVTTRERKLERAWTIPLKGLEEAEALALIRAEGQRIGMPALEQAADAVLLPLCRATGGAPLALKWAVGQIKQPGQSLESALAALYDARANLFDQMFTRSWEMLTPEAQRVLIAMPLFATSATREALEAVSDVRHFGLDNVLELLLEMSLMDTTSEIEITARRYSLHPLVRAFSNAQLKHNREYQKSIGKAMMDYYLVFARKQGGLWNNERFDIIQPELPNVLSVIRWCWENGYVNSGMEVLYKISDFMVIRGYWNDVMAFAEEAVRLACELGDEWNAARFRIWPLAWVYRHRGNLTMSEQHAREALNIMIYLGDSYGAAYAKRSLGRVHHDRGNLSEAEPLLREALAFYRSRYEDPSYDQQNPYFNIEASDPRNVFFVTADLAGLLLDMGDLDEAWDLCSSLLTDVRYANDLERVASFSTVLGNVAWQRGDLQRAKEFFSEALTAMQQVRRLDGIANALRTLARFELEIGEAISARDRLREAVQYYRRLAIPTKIEEIEALLAQLDQEHPAHA
ncbi:MAG: tetratricopeptide repeat protein [Anaerolineae bacterium]|nr:tetratricopeptide repeat protein [Anaerolineae bacterium]